MNQPYNRLKRLEEENRILRYRLEQIQLRALQAKELNNLFVHSKEVVLYAMKDKKGSIEAISDSISTYGYTPEDFTTGRLSLHDIIHPDDFPMITEHISRQTEKHAENFEEEYRLITRSGEPVWVASIILPEYDCQGRVAHFLMKIKDINKQKQYEKKLQNINKNLFATLKNIEEAVIITDADGYIDRLNTAAEILGGVINTKAKHKLLTDVMQLSSSEDFDFLIDPFEIEAENYGMRQYDVIFVKCRYRNEHFRASCTVSPVYGGKYKNVLTGYVVVIKGLMAMYGMWQENDGIMRCIFDHSTDGVLLIDSNGIIREWSNGYERLSGIAKEDAVGKSMWEVMSITLPQHLTGKERKRLREELDEILALMQQKMITRYVVHQKTGKLKIINVVYFPVTIYGQVMLGAIGRDVTEEVHSRGLLRRSEEKFRKSNDMLKSILRTAPTPLYVKDKHGRYIECNDAFLLQFGFTREQVIGKTVIDLFPKAAETVVQIDQNLLEGNPQKPNEINLETVNGLLECIVYRGILTHDDENGGIIGVVVDISELKKTRRRQSILIKILQILQSTENVPAALNVILGEIGKYADVSRVYILENNTDSSAFNAIYEWCAEDIDSGIGDMQHLSITDFHEWYDCFSGGKYICTTDFSTLKPVIAQMLVEQEVKSILAIPLLSKSEQLGFIGFDECRTLREWRQDEIDLLFNLSQIISSAVLRHRAEVELIDAKEKAEESDKLKSAFLASMSHEIRTPLNGIIGFLTLLASDNLTPERRLEYINIVNNSSKQLTKLIDDIIDEAKIEADQLKIYSVPTHINDLMNETQTFFETYLHNIGKDRVTLLLDDSGFIEPCVILIDPMRLRQVLNNLIGNAIKFTEKGYIRFGYRQLATGMLEFMVEDTGIGIAHDQLEVIFERFRQVDSNNNHYGGTGLGLCISRNLVRMMGGDMQVVSTKGSGSTFYFTIAYRSAHANNNCLKIN